MSEDREGFIFYRSFYECIRELSEGDQAALYDAIFDFSFNFKEPAFTGLKKSIWTLIRPLLYASKKNWENGSKPKNKKPNGSESEAKAKPNGSQTEGNKNKNKKKEEDKKENKEENKDNEEENEYLPRRVILGQWWKTASAEIFIEKTEKWKQENPNHGYPTNLFTDFIMHYTTPSGEKTIRINAFSNFGFQQKLYEWKNEVRNKDKYQAASYKPQKYIGE